MVLMENFFILDSSRQATTEARQLYHKLVGTEDFQFIVVENWRQNVKVMADYIKTYKAILDK